MKKLLLCICFFASFVYGSTFTIAQSNEGSNSLRNYGKVFVETNTSTTPQDVLNLPAEYFKEATSKLDAPYLTPIWFVVNIKNNTNTNVEYAIYNAVPGTDLLDFYVFERDRLLKHSMGGDTRRFEDKGLPSLYGFISIDIKPNQTLNIAIKYANQGRMQPAFFIQENKNFVFSNAAEMFFLVLMLGFLAAISSYNAIAYIASKNKLYGLYFVHVFAMLLFYIIVFGFLNIVFPYSVLSILNHSDRFIASFGGLFFGLFFTSFFNTKKNAPTIHKIVMSYVFIYGLLSIAGLYIVITNSIVPRVLDDILRPLYMVYMLSVFIAAVFMSFKKQKYAWIIAFAVACHLLTTSIVVALLTENVEHAYWQAPMMLFGYVLEVSFMSFALGLVVRDLNTKLKDSLIENLQLEQERRQGVELLIQSEKMAQLGNMLGTILHQWKQPLNSISLEAQYMKMGCSEEENKECIDKIIEHVDFMAKTADEFRDFYKPSKNTVAFEVQKEIFAVLSLVNRQLREQGIKVGVNSEEELYIDGYPQEFKHIILNIINNAKEQIELRKPKEAKIAIDISRQAPDAIIIKIADNAGGIDESLLPDAIFKPFVSTKHEKGTGIGLSLCKTIIEERMGGSITAKNSEEGAIFEIRLPAAKR